MRNKANKFGLIFLATASVYSGHAANAVRADDARGDGSPASASPTPAAGVVGKGFYFTKAANAAATNDRQAATVANVAAAPDVATPVEFGTTIGATDESAPTNDPFAQATVVDPSAGPRNTAGRSVTTDDVDFDDTVGTVEIHVNDASLVEVLRMLSLQSQKNIIASKDVKGTVTANLYGVTVREALEAILTSNGYTYREEGNFIYVNTAQEIEAQRQANRVRKTQVFRLYYTPVSTAVNMIKPVLSKDGEVAFTEPARIGLSSGAADAGGNSHSTEDVMVVTDYDDQLAEVRRVLTEIDKRPQQILVEATILRATLSEDNALGVDFQVLGGVDFSGLSAGNTSFSALAGGGIQNTGSASNIVNKGAVAGGTGFTGNVPAGGLQVGVVKNNIAIFLEALETVTDTTVLANPKILALNKQKGEIIVGREDGYVTSTTTDTATVQTVEFLQTGTRLIFRPYIGDDGFIRMEIHPEDSSGGLTGANLPFKITTEVTSNVMVRDGHTVVIGGLFREDSNSTRGQVPGLGNIPFAGALFRSQRDRTTREEIIILLTPHIVKDESAYARLSTAEMERMEQLRVGVRRGMMISGRERLAEGFYDGAVAELNKPNANRGRVLWKLNAATNLNPKFVEAIELRQQLNERRLTSVDNSIARDFVRKIAINDLNNDRVSPLIPAAPTTAPVIVKPTPKQPDMKAVTDLTAQAVGAAIEASIALATAPALDSDTQMAAFHAVPATQPTSDVFNDAEVITVWDQPQVVEVPDAATTKPAY